MSHITYRDVVEYLLSHVIQSSRINRITYEQAMKQLLEYLADNINEEHEMYLDKLEADKAFNQTIDDWVD